MFFYILDDSHLTHIQPAPHHVTRIQPTDRWTTFSNKTSHWVSKIVCQVSNMQLDVKRFGCPFGAMIATWFGYSVSNTGNTVTRPWKTNQKLATNVASKFSPAFFLTFWIAWNMLADAMAQTNLMDSVETTKTAIPSFFACNFTRLVTVKAGIKDERWMFEAAFHSAQSACRPSGSMAFAKHGNAIGGRMELGTFENRVPRKAISAVSGEGSCEKSWTTLWRCRCRWFYHCFNTRPLNIVQRVLRIHYHYYVFFFNSLKTTHTQLISSDNCIGDINHKQVSVMSD